MRRDSIPAEGLSSGVLNGYLMPLLAALVFAIFVIIAVMNTFITSKEYVADVIDHDIKNLVEIFKKIDTQCGILSFDYPKNHINFLNVAKFAGSEVGSMNLIHPENWQGPYMKETPRVQDKEYVVRKTDKGLFITPDDGIKLPNGKIIGKDIILDEKADIASLIKEEGTLKFKDKLLAEPLDLKSKSSIIQSTLIAGSKI